ncbi:insulinase family protein [Paenalcaligenes niemegkensis]|uniref:M16 family metallopeptidase n=1 Tax=Paenalcaligenes niemegkensis TaxID=2895469 RepID=UPI001EE896F3|nr:M16 family metallopeptidase [Paenalcaligenes niemegkensis]MCQ9617002.1 insulinase family protein [Paenalcaligenes niemegkensis]
MPSVRLSRISTRLRFTVVILCFMPGLSYALPKGITEGATIEGVTEYTLNNGLRVLLAADPSRPNTTVNMTYLVGARHENYGQTGMAHLLEHMLFRGTPKLPNALAEFSRRGLAANGTTSSDRTNYYASFAANPETLDWYIDWQADAMVNATISQADLDAEMTVVRNEMERGENSPFRVLMQKMQAAAYQWHNYGKSTIGARSDVENVDIAQLQAFYHEYYQPDNAVLIVSGQFDVDATLEQIAKSFSPLEKPTRKLRPEYTQEPVQDGTRTVALRRQGGSPIVAAQYHIPAQAHPDYTALSVGVGILGDTPSGRLYKAMVNSDLATSVFGFAAAQHDSGYAFFGAELQAGMEQEKALDTLNQTLETLSEHPFTDDEVNRIRSKWLSDWSRTYADSSQLASALSESVASGDWRLFFLGRDQIEKLKTEDVQSATARWLLADNRTNGLYIPTAAPERAPTLETTDLSELFKDYQGRDTAASAEAFEPTPDNIDERTQRESLELPNGLGEVKLALLPKASRGERVEALLTLRFGDPESLKGSRTIGDATAYLVNFGTKHLDRQSIDDKFTKLQADVSFNGNSNGITVSISTLGENLAPTLELALQVLRDANFPEEELNKYKAQLLTSYENAKNEPTELASLALARHDNPWSKDDIRYTPSFDEAIADAKDLNRADLLAFHERFYGTGDIRFSAAGSFDPDAVKKALTRGLSSWKKAPHYERAGDPFRKVAPELFNIDTPDKANAFYLAKQNIKLQDSEKDFAALYLANYMLGQSATSRLWNRVRVDEGLSYDVRSVLSVSSYEPSATWSLYAIHAPENSERVDATIKEEVQKVLTEGFSDDEVRESVDAILKYRQLARSQDRALASTWLSYLDLDRTFAWSQSIDDALSKLDAKTVNTVVRQYLDAEAFSTAIAADQSKQEQTATAEP